MAAPPHETIQLDRHETSTYGIGSADGFNERGLNERDLYERGFGAHLLDPLGDRGCQR